MMTGMKTLTEALYMMTFHGGDLSFAAYLIVPSPGRLFYGAVSGKIILPVV